MTKTRKQAPSDEVSKNAQLLIKAGYIHKDAAGIYIWLPLGKRVLDNIITIIREEMDKVGGQEVIMSSLQRKELWETTDRWDDEIVDVWFKSQYKNGTPVGFAWSHEEQMVDTFRQFVSSHRDLPRAVYQFQTKLRNETRAKSGIMRTREFIMKDMYSFARNETEHQKFYDEVTEAYKRVFQRLGIGDKTYFTFASGGAFAEFSHEFQTVCDAGEDIIYISKDKNLAINKEVLRDDVLNMLGVKRDELEEAKAAEVGNIFSFGTTKSEPFDFSFTDETGKKQYVTLGSYGIGPARCMGVITELLSDERGLIWPEAIAPYRVHLIRLSSDGKVADAADELYETLTAQNISVLYDDREDARAGEMMADADLIGIPYRVVVSERTLQQDSFELKNRSSTDTELLKKTDLLTKLAQATTG